MRRFAISVILILSLIAPTPTSQPYPEAKGAAVAAAAVPYLVIGAIALMLMVATASYQMNMISRQQNDYIQSEGSRLQERLRNATNEALRQSLAQSINFMRAVSSPLGLAGCGTIVTAMSAAQSLLRNSSGSDSRSGARSGLANAEGECEPDLRGDPYRCCGDFMRRLRSRATVEQTGRTGFRLTYFGRNGVTRRCCMEWDSIHGRFELYWPSNHDPYRHMGERACARQRDLEDDLCASSFPEKADNTGAHAPRQGCP